MCPLQLAEIKNTNFLIYILVTEYFKYFLGFFSNNDFFMVSVTVLVNYNGFVNKIIVQDI